MIDPAVQRENMVESQVRTNDVTDRRIIRAMAELPRERFVPASLKPVAYMDQEISLAHDADTGGERTMLQPMVLAKMVQLAAPEAGHLVLDVGCLTGYSTALLASLAGSVVALETDPTLAARATEALDEIGIDTAAVVEGPLSDGYPSQAPYDLIFVNGAVAERPDALCAQLKPGGRLVVILGGGPDGRVVAYDRVGQGVSRVDGFSASGHMLPGFAAPEVFSF